MKFQVQRTELLDALNICGKAVTKTFDVILENYLFNIYADSLRITGANNEIFISKVVKVKADDTALFCINAAKIRILLQDLPEQPLTFNVQKATADNAGQVVINSISGKYTFPIVEGGDFPQLIVKSTLEFELASNFLSEGIDRTSFACANGSQGEALDGLLVRIKDGKITFTGCNRGMLSSYFYSINSQEKSTLLLPVKAMATVKETCSGGIVKMVLSDKNVSFYFPDGTLIQSVIFNLTYPDVDSVIATDHNKFVSIDKNELSNSIKRVLNFAEITDKAVVFNFSSNSLKVSSSNKTMGEDANEDITCEYDGEDMPIRLNGNYLLQILSKIPEPEIYMAMTAYNKSIVFTSEFREVQTKDNLIILMPLML